MLSKCLKLAGINFIQIIGDMMEEVMKYLKWVTKRARLIVICTKDEIEHAIIANVKKTIDGGLSVVKNGELFAVHVIDEDVEILKTIGETVMTSGVDATMIVKSNFNDEFAKKVIR